MQRLDCAPVFSN